MSRPVAFTAAVALAALISGCTVREGRMALPAHLPSATERLELRGMGGGTRGDFELGNTRGTFSRSAERLGIFDPVLVRHEGGGSFHLDGTAASPSLGGRCAYREGQFNVGPIAVTPKRLAFHCEFARGDRLIDAAFVLEDPQSAIGTVHGRSERRGTLFYEDEVIAVRSIHRDQAGGLPISTPLGYIFSDEQSEIGAVDLNGLNKTVFAPLGGKRREAVLAASLALSIFWDPAEVQPDT